ncbi:MAG: 6-bladed beta-propeller [Gammaproteobacteria bacterium]|nr:6-bladed beta-propeller [Gammaproteobacteria bacterium]
MNISCTSVPNKDSKAVVYPVWPAPPATARIKLTAVFSLPQDLEIGKGFWSWLGNFFLGSEAENMVRPMAVVANDRRIYVADPGAYGVHLYDLKENSYKLIQLPAHHKMLSPVGISGSGDGGIYISDSKRAEIYYYKYGEEAATLVELDEAVLQPTGIRYNQTTKELFVVDTKNHQIVVFDETGGLIRYIGRRGDKNGEFNFPTMLWWDKDQNLFVTDSLNFRIQKFNKNGKYLQQFGKAGDATGFQSRPKGVAVDKKGHIYVVDSLFHNVQIFDSEGRYLLSFGEQGQAPGQFWLPTGIYIDDMQKIYVADSHNKRVQVFELEKAVR